MYTTKGIAKPRKIIKNLLKFVKKKPQRNPFFFKLPLKTVNPFFYGASKIGYPTRHYLVVEKAGHVQCRILLLSSILDPIPKILHWSAIA